MEWLKNTFVILNIIWALFICLIGGYLVFRSIKPRLNKEEMMHDDLKDIKEQWNWDGTKGEPPIDYVYRYVCRFERGRIYTKIGMFILGLIIVCFGAGLMIENIK